MYLGINSLNSVKVPLVSVTYSIPDLIDKSPPISLPSGYSFINSLACSISFSNLSIRLLDTVAYKLACASVRTSNG